ncbi:MAG: hypothetical protein QM831_16620 [Kofleriaceae bacterium]
MGVYATVHICIEREVPLGPDLRAAVAELAIENKLITKKCSVSVPTPAPIRGLWDALRAVVGQRRTYFEPVQEGEPGSWVADRVMAIAGELRVSSPFPTWKDEELTGPFIYAGYTRPRTVKMFNAYREPGERNRFEPPDGVIGRFFDVIEIEAKRDYDGRTAASSKFVKDLKKELGAKIICRTSWA